ncbi:T9SS type A sorting domain-containing protein [Mesonia sp.]|uniref:T9SS type A sorting domain-containing protein n=1 Tax=Mesonia sp. TaxID=1960830 RepID=UPI001766A8A9|nr:T9SS type A sorting domain-containing protein [Mesonia sp.]HIB38471.1 T9SS type A sorting domain-containing protein [Mesonia sp.]HIO27131.1 T9SS type A sorting domain-containing protein [Flavobacteriaceae bacterium]
MKKNYSKFNQIQLLFLTMIVFFSVNVQAQVTEIYTNYLGYWKSTSTNQNSILPENSHAVLAFTASGTTYSTGVNDVILNNQSVTYSAQNFRALPILTLPTTGGSSYWLGFGQLYDGIDNGADTSTTNPFNANPTGAELASYLTTGPHGLDLGTYFTNIPSGTNNRFELSSAGLDLANIGDGVPDIFVSQIAQPGGADQLRFVNSSGATVGNSVSLTLTSAPSLGTWKTDLYQFTSQPSSQINISKTMRFAAIELSQFGINASNVADAVALIYIPGGSSDPAFIAYNEPSIPVASRIDITAQPTTSNCDGTMPSSFTIQITDDASNSVAQAGFNVTASIKTGPGDLFGTVTQTTDATGQATFNDLVFEVGGDHTIAFNSSSLDEEVSATILDATGCGDATWTGAIDNDWNDVGNWDITEVPNANYNVTIPTGLTNYPILDVNTGADNLIMGDGATIELNGFLFTIQGAITAGTAAYIDGSVSNSELNFSGQAAQTIPSGFVNGDLANLTIANPNGVIVNTTIDITEILDVDSGQLTTNGNITLKCDFTGNVAQLDQVTGSISGDITTEQCFPARRAYRFVTSSVNTTSSIRENWQEDASSYTDNPNPGYGTHITGVDSNSDGYNGFDYTPSGLPSMYELNNVSQTWFTTPNTDVTTLTAGEPYRLMIRGDRSINVTDNETTATNTKLRATGTVAIGTTNFSSGFSSTEGHFNFFGNPYQAIVDMSAVLANATSSNVNTLYYYIWDPTQGTRGAYSTIDVLTNSGTVGAGNKFLQPMQAGFFLTGSAGTTPTLSFLEENKAVNQATTSVFRNANSLEKSIHLKLYTEEAYNNGDNASDGLKIKFEESADNMFNNNDAPKMFNLDESIARDINGNLSSIEKRSLPLNNESLQLFTTNYKVNNYRFEAELNGLEDYDVYLKDNFTNTLSLISDTENTYSFSVEIDNENSLTVANDRFELVFAISSMNNENFFKDQFSIYPNPTTGWFNIQNSSDQEIKDISIYNLLGRKVYNSENIEDNNINISQLQAGVYLVKVNTTNGNTITKKIIKK